MDSRGYWFFIFAVPFILFAVVARGIASSWVTRAVVVAVTGWALYNGFDTIRSFQASSDGQAALGLLAYPVFHGILAVVLGAVVGALELVIRARRRKALSST